jgi:hypothetical protein
MTKRHVTAEQIEHLRKQGLRLYPAATAKDLPEGAWIIVYEGVEYAISGEQ